MKYIGKHKDGTRYYYIRPEQLEEYLAKGYTLGKPKKN